MTPWLDDGDVRLYHGDALDVLAGLPDGSVDCVVTSPPYWGLRSYGVDGQYGLEETPDEFVTNMVAVFQEVRRVLADHGTCWVNLGDTYNSRLDGSNGDFNTRPPGATNTWSGTVQGLAAKNLMGMPWRVAFGLQADGWILRSDIIWAKPNPMPESVTDRPTKSHEYVFLLTKRPRYWFDAEAVREPHESTRWGGPVAKNTDEWKYRNGGELVGTRERDGREFYPNGGRNVRSVWQIATQPYPEAHFATFPEELARRCILAGCPVRVCGVCGKPSERIVEAEYEHVNNTSPREQSSYVASRGQVLNRHNTTVGWSDCGHNNWRPGQVLDPFIGSGTVAKVARDHQRHAIGIDLSAEYLELAARRLQQLSLLT